MGNEDVIKAFYSGMRQGVLLYAHWRDGVQYVGTTGRTLEKALSEIAAQEAKDLDDANYYNGGKL